MKLRKRYHFLLYLFFWQLCKHRSTSSRININFFLQQFKLLIQKLISCISRFGRNSVLAGILFAQWRTTLAHVFTSGGKHLGSENANDWVESCSEGRGEYHACLTREISLYPLQNYLATDSFMSAMHLQIFSNFFIVLWYQKVFSVLFRFQMPLWSGSKVSRCLTRSRYTETSAWFSTCFWYVADNWSR